MTKYRMKFLNTNVDNVNMKEAIEIIDGFIKDGKYHYVVTPNVDHIVRLEKDEEFKKVYENADLILTDGMPLVWISKWLKTPVKEKVSGSDLFPRVCKLAAEKEYTVFILGAAEGVAHKAGENLKAKYKGLKVAGTYSPSFGFEKKPEEIKYIIEMINDIKPDILAVGVSAPKQEKFVAQYRDELKVPVALAIGASIDIEAGTLKRAPLWMQKSGLEWFYRMFRQPKKIFKRVFFDDLKIIGIYSKYRSLG
ncbi:exopolysaccharide biosynthesis WecB/TagA/CpsF family protein [Clostridium acetobutylicum]|uniref:Teichoic acid biosynthesis protein, tagA n=2 Tax=Clostridium acetobutylicum TaxID=1488 RepID=Q97GP9_CLOAB|nr:MULTISPECIES: WecB/TagA/CpsF family glycosyltransferase [Clostridium]AAK80273.1 Teichoic acid biosynthesis protein, tagA [Clostridium acetobutylicum ATCC 824]ADZ21369.1 Teichoic acid biosynthesis protein, tagA [Clostridium acetobutylicum EA 2018]AEI33360.1 teichoic acid biosynthesis protein, tagA [Clostridium acetobutylicum DSM 1731]AWV79304.1 glycosyltransferase [Clostridium acetobutylicum]MBC2394726.1 WecB/TagA/CpsF family glycosyltransferase [Clostridium acetobutylicum]